MKDRSPQTFRPFTAVRQGSKHVLTRVPTDLVGVTGYVLVAAVALAVVDVASPVVRAAVGFPLLLFAPGYATVSALFPRESPARANDVGGLIGQTNHVSDVERAALAFGLSLAVLPLLGLGIAIASLGFGTTTVVAVVSAYTLFGVWLAAVRRLRVPSVDRYRFALGRKLATVRNAIVDTNSVVHTVANVVLVASLLIALTSVGYAFAAPQQGEEYTDLQLLTEDESGELVAGDYPSTVASGDPLSFTIGVENQESEDRTYTAVVQEQWISDGEVLERTELERDDYQLDQGATGYSDQELTPEAESGDVRITVLLYEDEVPEDPTIDNAYRYGYFWTEISDDADPEDE